jgi:hypothetical protein
LKGYLETILINQNVIHEVIKSRFISGNACYYSVQNIFFSGLLPQNIKIKICRTTVLPVVLYGCEIWSREERSLRVFVGRALRKIFGPKRDEVTGEWSILHNEELYDAYSSPNVIAVIQSIRMIWARHVARMGEKRCMQGFDGKIRGKETTWKT